MDEHRCLAAWQCHRVVPVATAHRQRLFPLDALLCLHEILRHAIQDRVSVALVAVIAEASEPAVVADGTANGDLRRECSHRAHELREHRCALKDLDIQAALLHFVGLAWEDVAVGLHEVAEQRALDLVDRHAVQLNEPRDFLGEQVNALLRHLDVVGL